VQILSYFFLAAYIIVAFPNTAHAYIDPGSGTILLQVLFALFGGAILTFRKMISDFFKGILRKNSGNKK